MTALSFIGSSLRRPECVLANKAGDVFAADWRGGVAHIRADGSQALYAGKFPDGRPLRPNGIALRADGSFLLADLGETLGGIYALSRDGEVTPLLERVDGIDLPPTNFVTEDRHQRIWITVSTRQVPRAHAYRRDVADGFVVCMDERGARVVADGLGYTNEALVSPDGLWLYVNETFARRLSRFRIDAGGDLRNKEVVTQFGHGSYPDGLAFDAEGCVWITSIVSNRVIRVDAGGKQTLIIADEDPAHTEWAEQAYLAGAMGREHLDKAAGKLLRNISSLAFGGADLRTAYLGCLLGENIGRFRVPIAGSPPTHWNFPR